MALKKKRILYSVVIPVFNSEKILMETIRQTGAFFRKQGLNYELILVNDCSPDGSWNIIATAVKKDRHVIGINLLKNYGQHTAVYCGFEHSTGDYVITMDDDLQNPPDEIVHLIRKAEEGHDLVFARFIEKKHSLFRRLGTKIIAILNAKIFNKPPGLVLSNFRIIRRDVLERMRFFKTQYPYIPGLLLLHANNPANAVTEHHVRSIGKSNYSLMRIISLVARLLFNYSAYPLKLLSLIGVIIAMASFGTGIGLVIRKLIVGSSIPGWTSLIVLMSFFHGITLLLIGLIGEYLGRIVTENSNMKTYHVIEVARAATKS